MAADGGGGGGDIGARLFAQGIGQGGGPAGSKEDPKSLSDLINSLFDMVENWVAKTGFVPKGIGKVSMMGGTDLTQGGIRVGGNILTVPEAAGGAGARIIGQIFSRPDFSSLGPMPQGDPMVMNTGVEVGWSNLGALTPPDLGGVGYARGSGLDLGVG